MHVYTIDRIVKQIFDMGQCFKPNELFMKIMNGWTTLISATSPTVIHCEGENGNRPRNRVCSSIPNVRVYRRDVGISVARLAHPGAGSPETFQSVVFTNRGRRLAF